VVEWESEVIGEWQVRPPFFPLFSLSLSSRSPPACCVGEGTGWVKRELEGGKAHVVVNLQDRLGRTPVSVLLSPWLECIHFFFPPLGSATLMSGKTSNIYVYIPSRLL